MSRLLSVMLALVLIAPAFAVAERSANLVFASGTLGVNPSASISNNTSMRELTVVVGRTGFNGSSRALSIQVDQGERVRINFVYGDSDLRQDNPHIVTIEGYNIQTGEIGRKNPIETVEFTAGQVGKFRFYCSIPCLGMENLQQGFLEVNPPKLQTFIRTNASARHLEIHHPNVAHFIPHTDLLHVVAYLTDEKGSPVVGVLVDFLVGTSFGAMKVASNVTEADGSAHLLYPLVSLRQMMVVIDFGGSGIYRASNSTQVFSPDIFPGEAAETPYLSGQNTLVDPRVVGVQPYVGAILVAVIAVVVGAVWSTYAHVLSQILKIKSYCSKRDEGAG